MASAISVAVVAILLGVPLWWKTTEVYRAPLPYDAIANLSHLLVSVQASVTELQLPTLLYLLST